jgi:hypothetical protein
MQDVYCHLVYVSTKKLHFVFSLDWLIDKPHRRSCRVPPQTVTQRNGFGFASDLPIFPTFVVKMSYGAAETAPVEDSDAVR